jgi:23S rRNA pseudouridine2605 synthase
MDQFTKEGRKLRPRKTAAQSQDHSGFEKVEFHFGERNDSSNEGGERRSYGENRSYGERRPRQYGENRGYGERRSYGENREGGERRSYGENRGGYGDRRPRQYGENRGNYGEGRQDNGGERRSYGENRGNYGERRPRQYGENRGSYGDRKPRQYGEGEGQRRSYGENREGGYNNNERRSYGEGGGFSGERRPRQAGGRPSFNGERKSFGKKPFGAKKGAPGRKGAKPVPHFNKNTNEGISRMIERRPVVNGNESAETFNSPIQDVVRLNKFIANSGVCSRREADTLIQAGVVTVNGEVVTELGTKVNVQTDDIRFNGERLKGEEKVYIVMNKPKGFVTTASDPHAEKTVIDLLKGCSARVYPVGRLDKNTTGVLMLTNDGEIAERLTHPAYDKKKIYQVALDRELSEEDHDKILAGVTLTDGEVNADELEYIDEKDKRKLGIEIHSGKNRVVRRIFESLGYTVKALDRVYFAGLTKKGLKKGEWRYLTEGEANILKMGAYV